MHEKGKGRLRTALAGKAPFFPLRPGHKANGRGTSGQIKRVERRWKGRERKWRKENEKNISLRETETGRQHLRTSLGVGVVSRSTWCRAEWSPSRARFSRGCTSRGLSKVTAAATATLIQAYLFRGTIGLVYTSAPSECH